MPTGSSSASPGIRSGITCLLPGVGAEAVLNGNLAVVKDNPFGNTAEILKYLNQRIQKALLILPAVCQNHGDTAVAQSRAEEVDGSFDTVQIDGRLTPVNLQGISRRKDKRNECAASPLKHTATHDDCSIKWLCKGFNPQHLCAKVDNC